MSRHSKSIREGINYPLAIATLQVVGNHHIPDSAAENYVMLIVLKC